jgi:rhodanese-related sulfurtransferase
MTRPKLLGTTPRLLVLCAAALAGGLFLAQSAMGKSHPEISPQALNLLIQGNQAPVVLDVRSEEEFRSGHIPGAVNLPVTQMPGRIDDLAAYKDREVVVLCEVGPRAGMASGMLKRSGFEDLVELKGHMRAWRNAGLPTEK